MAEPEKSFTDYLKSYIGLSNESKTDVEEPSQLDIFEIPLGSTLGNANLNLESFTLPITASDSDEKISEDDAGHPVFRSKLDGSTYTIMYKQDQRTDLTKIKEDVIPAIKEYADNPYLPTGEQVVGAAKSVAGSIYDTISIPGDVASGERNLSDVTMGDVYGIAGSGGAMSTLGRAPANSLRTFGGVGMEGSGTNKSFKRAKKLLRKSPKINKEKLKGGAIDFNTNKKIWEETNWYVDPNDGQWRFYIDDSKSTLEPFEDVFNIDGELNLTFKELSESVIAKDNPKSMNLEELFNHSDLYKKYPELKTLGVNFYSNPKSDTLGSAVTNKNKIYLNLFKFKNYEDLKSVILHEVQHIVQDKEGFVPGANTKDIPEKLTADKNLEISNQLEPLEKKEKSLQNEFNSTERLFNERLKNSNEPLTGLTADQEFQISKLKTQVTNYEIVDGLRTPITELTGPSWASIGRDYGVKPAQIQKAWGRQNQLNDLKKEKNKLNSDLLKIGNEISKLRSKAFNVDYEFYRGAGGEIEARLVGNVADVSLNDFPVSLRKELLKKEGDLYEFQGNKGVDPFVYRNQPRKDPSKNSFLDKLKSELTKKTKSFISRSNSLKKYTAFNQKALEVAAKQNDLSREILVYMPIEDFLRAAKKEVSQTKLNNTKNLVKEGKPFDTIPSLNIKNNGDGTAKVTDHDGRHRAMVLKEQGETTIPVRLLSQAGGGPSIRWGQQNNPDSPDYVKVLPQKLIEEDGNAIVGMPEVAANIRKSKSFMSGLKFAEGGSVNTMENQMKMFEEGGIADDGMNRDPVSGNEVPSGSLAIEVRDDIPAQLSEGEYVVPADVVRYFGVRVFEEMRMEAKMGLQQMEQDGRIGGEPIDTPAVPSNTDDLSPEEQQLLQEIMAMEQPSKQLAGYAAAGLVGGSYMGSNSDYVSSPTRVGDQFKTLGGSFLQTGSTGAPSMEGSVDPVAPISPVVNKVCPPGQIFSEKSQMCIISPTTYKNNDDDGGGGQDLPEPEDWGIDIDWTKSSGMTGYVDSVLTPMDPALQKSLQIGGALLGGPIGLLAAGAGIADAMNDLSNARATSLVARAMGDDTTADAIDAQIEEYVKTAPAMATSWLGNWLSSGTSRAGSLARQAGFDSLEDAANNAAAFRKALGGTDASKATKQKVTDGAEEARLAKLAIVPTAAESEAVRVAGGAGGKNTGKGGIGSTYLLKTGQGTDPSGNQGTGYGGQTSTGGQMTTPQFKMSDLEEEEEKIDASNLSDDGKYFNTRFNKGGLIARPKKKTKKKKK